MAKLQNNKSEIALKPFGCILFKVFHITLKPNLRKRIFVFDNNNNIYLLQLGCHPVAVVISHVNKT